MLRLNQFQDFFSSFQLLGVHNGEFETTNFLYNISIYFFRFFSNETVLLLISIRINSQQKWQKRARVKYEAIIQQILNFIELVK